MRKIVTALMAFLLIHITFSVSAQTIPVSGRVVSSDNTPVVSASVLLKGKRTGTKTDANGNFTINANCCDVLVISGVGFTSREVRVSGSFVSLTLQTAQGVLEQVSVTTASDLN